jgi:hypothetical protein
MRSAPLPINFYTEEGPTLTFEKQPFTWEELLAPSGEYLVGFIAEDLDGNSYEEAVVITVE